LIEETLGLTKKKNNPHFLGYIMLIAIKSPLLLIMKTTKKQKISMDKQSTLIIALE
jgi:hypothetical protein